MTKILNLNKKSVAEALKQGDITISTAEMNYLGISLTALFTEEGARVIGCDTNPSIVNLLNEGKTEVCKSFGGALKKGDLP